MGKLISVIVPIYNTEKYLKKCIESILGQTYSCLELILVNDGSTDNSIHLCKEFASCDERVRIVDKRNGGLSSARNAGLKVAKGEYITFVDSDDYLELGAIDNLYNSIKKYNADISCMESVDVDENYQRISDVPQKVKEIEIIDGYACLKGICERKMSGSVCNKMFTKRILNNVCFEEGRLNEDFLFLGQLMILRKVKIVQTHYYGYNYYTRINSISHSGFGKSSVDAVYNTVEMKELAKKHAPNMVPFLGAYAVYQARTALVLMSHTKHVEKTEFMKYCKQVIFENRKYISKSFMKPKDKLFCCLYLLCPKGTLLIAGNIRRRMK